MYDNGGKTNSKFLKRIIFLGLALMVYILLTSTIYNATMEIKMTDYLIESTLYYANIRDAKSQLVISREKDLTGMLDLGLAERLKGKVLIQAESNGEAWYVDPVNLKRYYLGKPREAYLLIKDRSKSMSADDIIDYIYFDKKFPKELSGRFLKNEDEKSEYYYIIPEELTALKIETPNEAYKMLKERGLGINNVDIRKIEVAD